MTFGRLRQCVWMRRRRAKASIKTTGDDTDVHPTCQRRVMGRRVQHTPQDGPATPSRCRRLPAPLQSWARPPSRAYVRAQPQRHQATVRGRRLFARALRASRRPRPPARQNRAAALRGPSTGPRARKQRMAGARQTSASVHAYYLVIVSVRH
ncbi:hypothetical protein PHLGIDRAFT_178063 [Phlebiopsis gigantea 11061_1 CR5-6]|uniref:Uncharacterized protein n=1 Tax=Phlebiopsis gigantea (strain 11061_1 CR5-6) TaxID=745531 RepID=A0A0C3PGI0_PHLG1|nr:hypothetical protein PHLGIDRAFT_178063 [Phlebiopsis gigantea 11061_1 CR5-6]